ncbi:MAG: hypothetical protein GY795_15285 [Desulfobacterales bacterium]|nr:hypothetical protein [Desulfobacterales bacterium]
MENYEDVIRRSLSNACQASFVRHIEKGRKEIVSLPRKWVLNNIHSIATDMLDLSDEWEYRRLLELYDLLHKQLVIELTELGTNSNNEEIQEAADDFKDMIEKS